MIRVAPLLYLLLTFAFATAATAAPKSPKRLPGWESGVRVNGNAVQLGSPVVAEIDGNTANGLETAVTTPNGYVNVVSSTGTLLWSYRLPNAACASASNNKAFGAPAVGALYGDGVPYVVASYGGLGARTCDGGVVALRGSDGTLRWKFSTQAWQKKQKYWSNMYGVFSTPALADVDFDGKLEIGFGSFDRNVYLLNYNGSVRWYYTAADTVWSSATFANVDRDPRLEMIIGTDISQNNLMRPVTKNGGYVYAFKTQKRRSVKINFRDKTAYVWQTYLNQVVYAAPVVANVIPSSAGDEVVVESGCYFPERTTNKGGKWIKVLRAKDGAVLRTLPVVACSSSTPAIADVNGDGRLDIVATISGASNIGGDGASRLQAWDAQTSSLIWSLIPTPNGRNDSNGGWFQSPVVADLDGNGSLEVVVINGNSVGIYNGSDGSRLTCESYAECYGGAANTQFPLGDSTKSTPAIADVDGDGKLDLVVAGGSGGNAHLRSWTKFDEILQSYSGTSPAYSAPWPMWRGDARRRANAAMIN